MKQKHIILSLALLCGFLTSLSAQDTTRRSIVLPLIRIIQPNSRPETIKAQTPTQVASSESMERLGDAQLSDVLRRMVGVSLKDYGGIGGIKTVSARGLGSQFSTLTIDGIAVTDCQNADHVSFPPLTRINAENFCVQYHYTADWKGACVRYED